MQCEHGFRFAYCGQVVHPIPFLDERQVLQEARLI
jgi:hypothetical protein